jgi:hypothetical protein
LIISKVLYISPYIGDRNSGGSIVANNNLKYLKMLYGNVFTISLSKDHLDCNIVNLPAPSNTFLTALYNLRFISGRLTPKSISTILHQVNAYDIVFLDSSSLGVLAKKIKKNNPSLKIITFFHNVEFDFQMQKVKVNGIQYFISAISEWVNERCAVNFSDCVISMHKEDSEKIKLYYSRFADFTLPVCIDVSNSKKESSKVDFGYEFMLFVGSAFYANVEAISFINDEIAPYLKKRKIVVVGKGLADSISIDEFKNIIIFSDVDDLESFYNASIAVIAPIFSGAGMKVKVAEALSFGKVIAGTDNALVGYDINQSDIFITINNARDFIEFIDNYPGQQINDKNRIDRYFKENYSIDSGHERFRRGLMRLGFIQ